VLSLKRIENIPIPGSRADEKRPAAGEEARMSDPKRTGISGITGKMVVIRHATGNDLERVAEYLDQFGKTDLNEAEVVVAAESGRIIGFSLLKKGGDDTGCVSLFEDSRRRGIGSAILDHLMRDAPMKKIYSTRYASFFSHAGFENAGSAPSGRARGRRRMPCRLPLMQRLTVAAAKPA
jgi:N-acetylglutamate synthase-like GNAT family acetyltransferase